MGRGARLTATFLLLLTAVVEPSSTSSLHAVLGINWDSLRDRASHNGYYLTTDFVPEVLSPVMVRVATLFSQILTTSWWLQASGGCSHLLAP